MSALARLAGAELAVLLRRRWLAVVAAAGLAAVAAVALRASGATGQDRSDLFRAGAASLLLLGGLVVAVGLGAAALNRPADSGHLGLLAAAGVGRGRLAAVVLGARVSVLAAVLALWLAALLLAGLALGGGLDGPLVLHGLTMAENMLLALLLAALVSSVVGRIWSGAFGLGGYVLAQAVVNLQAAADQGVLGTADAAVRAAHAAMPRAIVSEMIFLLAVRDAAGPAAPTIEIIAPAGDVAQTVIVPPSSAGTVLWTLTWCAVIALVACLGLRRRTLA